MSSGVYIQRTDARNVSTGTYSSVANGIDNAATGYAAFAAGSESAASGDYSIAMGRNTAAAGAGAVAIGARFTPATDALASLGAGTMIAGTPGTISLPGGGAYTSLAAQGGTALRGALWDLGTTSGNPTADGRKWLATMLYTRPTTSTEVGTVSYFADQPANWSSGEPNNVSSALDKLAQSVALAGSPGGGSGATVSTGNNTPTEIPSYIISFATTGDTVFHVRSIVLAKAALSAEAATFELTAVYLSNGGGTSLSLVGGFVTTLANATSGATTWAATLDVGVSGLRVLVTGQTATTINWRAYWTVHVH